MCGITGSVNADGRAIDRAVLERMNLAIIHRGPDEDGFYVKENIGLAMRRLSIIDLAGGQQPISNEDGSKWIVFNGEIYNYQDLRQGLLERGHKLRTKSDTEVIVHLYDEYGPGCLEHLRGMFALAIWDENDKSLFLARDRVGKKPLLYSHQLNGDLIFGSEFRAVLEHPSITREVDHDAIDNYMSYLCVPAPQTAFKHIRKLEPGHWLRWRDGQIETKRYWLPDFSKKIKISEPEAIEETIRIMRESTRLRLISEVPIGAFLSGGVDSSIVVALMAQESSGPVKTFSIGFEEQDFSELKYARGVAEHVGAEYNEFIVRPDALEILPTLVEHYGEPFADSSAIPTYYVARETRKHVTVALNGDGGDESFAGYERYVAMAVAEVYKRIPRAIRGPLIEGPINLLPTSEIKKTLVRDVQRFFISVGEDVPDRYVRWMSTFKPAIKNDIYTDDFEHSIDRQQAGQVLNKWIAKANGTGLLDKMLLADLMTYLPNDLLVKVDIASMANSLEARSPFLDHNVIEFAASLPEELKMSRFRPKSLLKKVAAKLVPREVVYRPKMGFGVPVGRWFRGEMKGFVRDILLGERALSRGIVKRDKIEEYVALHTSGQADHSFQIWTLLMLELWYQRFID